MSEGEREGEIKRTVIVGQVTCSALSISLR